jgi:hypothetical protein
MSALSDALTALRIEINAALTVLEPQIRGLQDLQKVSLSPQAIEEITQTSLTLQRRKKLLNDVIVALNALEAALKALLGDGYPEVPKSSVSPEIAAELHGQALDLVAAFGMFEVEDLSATSLKVALGAPVPKDAPPVSKK